MALLKEIELIASSKKSRENATQNTVTEASKIIRNIKSVHEII